jgi:hypothetical protein
VVVGIEEAGGVVVSAHRDGALLLTTPLPSLDLQVVANTSVVPYGVPTVSLEGTGLVADADSAGRVRFPSLIAGHYTVAVRFPMLDALGFAPLHKDTEVRVGAPIDSIRAPLPEDVLRQACGADAVRAKTAVLFGALGDSVGSPSSGVVHVTWPASVKVLASRKGDDQLSWVDQMRGVLVGVDGRYKLCGVPRQGIVVRAEGPSGVAAKFTRLFEQEPLRNLDLTLSNGAAAVRDDAAGAPTLAYVELRVVRNDGSAASGVSADITDANGRRTRVKTDEAGRSLLVSLPVGITRVRTRGVASDDVTVETSLSAGRNVVVITLASP